MANLKYSSTMPKPVATQAEKILGKNAVNDRGCAYADPSCPSASFPQGNSKYVGEMSRWDYPALML